MIKYNGITYDELPQSVVDSWQRDFYFHEPIAVDVETDTSKTYGTIKEYGLSYLADVTVFSCAWYLDDTYHRLAFNAPFTKQQLALIDLALRHETVIAHNAVFDLRQLSRVCSTMPARVWCTQTMQRLLFPAVFGKYGLLDVAKTINDVDIPEFMFEQKKKRKKQHEVDLATVVDYASYDSLLALQIYHAQQNHIMALEDSKLLDCIHFEIKAVTEYCIMARRGIGINKKYAEKRIAELTKLYDDRRGLLPASLNLASPKQKVDYIYGELGIPKPAYKRYSPFYTGAMNMSSSSDAIDLLLELANLTEYQRDRLMAIRDCTAIQYIKHDIENLIDHASVDGAVHTMLATEANTRRRTSTNPQMHNKKLAGNPDDIEGNLTGVFCPVDRDEFTYVGIDFSNAENKFQAIVAQDHAFARACNETDFHAYNAEQLFPEFKTLEPHSDRWEYLRFLAKSIVFGTAYGMEAERLSVGLRISIGEARIILQNKKALYRQVEVMKQKAQNVAKLKGYITLWTGAKVYIHPAQVYTAAWNGIMQGGVAECTKRSMVLIAEKFRELGMQSYVAHDMHDELIFGIHRDEWDRAIEIASYIMSNVLPAEWSNRTNPPIYLTAKPDWRKNRLKWGMLQYHPKHCIIKKSKQVAADKQGDIIMAGAVMPHVHSVKLPVWIQTESGSYVPGELSSFTKEAARQVIDVWKKLAILQGWSDSKLESILGYSLKELSVL